MNNWRTTIGGAVGNFGKALAGAGVLGQFTDAPPNAKTLLWYTAFVGFILSCAAGFLTSLFTADAKTLKEVVAKTNDNTNEIAAVKSETSFVKKQTLP